MLGVCNYRTMGIKARMVIEEYCPECLSDMSAVPIEKIAEQMGLDIEYQYLSKNGDKVLGKLICTDGLTPYYDMEQKQYMLMEVNANTIIVEARLLEQDNQGRYRFTVAHELAHWILHREKIIADNSEAAFIMDSETKMERQADYFASALLMPITAVKKFYHSIGGLSCNRSKLISSMSERFGVSKQAMQIYLRHHNLI